MAKKEVKTNKKENNKNKKSFAKEFKAELKKVVWPTSKQLVNNTVAVISIVLITAAIVFVLDFVFNAINQYGIGKIKEVITTTENTVIDEKTENEVTVEEISDEQATEENTEETENNTGANSQ